MITKKFIRSKKIKPSRIERQKYYKRTIKKYDKVKVEKNIKIAKVAKVAKGSHSFFINSCNYDKTPHLDESILYKYLLALGLVPDSRAMAYVDNQYKLIMSEKKISKKDFCYIFDLKLQIRIPNNIIKADVFFYNINSFHLDKLFYKYPKFLCNILNYIETFLLSDQNKFKFPENYILRPKYGQGGHDIIYAHNKQDIENAIKYYKVNKDIRNQIYNLDEIIVSKVISDLLLFNGRKFHLRTHLIVAVLEGEISLFISDSSLIITAKEEYNLNIPFTKSVHDTHFKTTNANYLFPDDISLKKISNQISNDTTKDNDEDHYEDHYKDHYEDHEDHDNNDNKKIKNIVDEIQKGIRDIAKNIGKIVLGHYKGNPKTVLYDNQDNGYQIYGLDILVKSNLEPVLVECNHKPGFGFHNDKNILKMKKLSELIYGWVNETILEPLFKYPGKATYHATKHRTYIPIK